MTSWASAERTRAPVAQAARSSDGVSVETSVASCSTITSARARKASRRGVVPTISDRSRTSLYRIDEHCAVPRPS